jgi:hypothetical protein
MYSPDGPSIVVGSLRPAGRRAFTCGHEIGHHVLGHGFKVDELMAGGVETARDAVEYSADRFAAALLMPKLAVAAAFRSRGWSAQRATAAQLYVVAGSLGVGYSTLVGYLKHTLRELSSVDATRLAAERTAKTRQSLLGFAPANGLLVIDEHWGPRPADVEVGDHVLLPAGTTITGDAIAADRILNAHVLAKAMIPGCCTASVGTGIAVKVRVSRSGFRGLAQYRYLEDADEYA